ncbi:MAG: topA [Acidobacteriaceae bacterium]|nr:topA [Acidobacteriaceae bacterium]
MSKSLVIVESPAKAKSIGKYLGKDYVVEASIGHVKDLPKNKIGVELENGTFEPYLIVMPDKVKVVDRLRKLAGKATFVYLAPDPDREGEAIAAHLEEELREVSGKNAIQRVTFNEITPKAVRAAFEHPRQVDRNLVDAQQTRRVLDRIVGYQISPLLWDKVRRGLSAGRVQTVALRLIVEREREIKAFNPVEYWTIDADLKTSAKEESAFTARFVGIDGQSAKVDTVSGNALPNEAMTKEVLAALEKAKWSVREVERKERRKNPAPPFTTSRIQQDASRQLGFSVRRTMGVAQRLYEGIELGEQGTVGLITYMRTDSTRVSPDAIADVRAYISGELGSNYLPESPNTFKSKKDAQDAHEAIRPTDVSQTPESVKRYLSDEQFRLYQLIWRRFVASQMLPAVFDQTIVDIAAQPQDSANARRYDFRVTGSILKFDGYLKVYEESKDAKDEDDDALKNKLPDLNAGQALLLEELKHEQKFTEPPPRYNEASLVKTLEERGIGRPSTYATILSTIQEREYVQKMGQGRSAKFLPTEIGFVVADLLIANFPYIFDPEYTAKLETELDDIEDGKERWTDLLTAFYGHFKKELQHAEKHMDNVKRMEKPTDEKCDRCGAPLVLKWGKFGSFYACSTYDKKNKESCTFTKENFAAKPQLENADEKEDEYCEACGRVMILRNGPFGPFMACPGYNEDPPCKTVRRLTSREQQKPPVPIGEPCPTCGKDLVRRTGRFGEFVSCSGYPECKYIKQNLVEGMKCPKCNEGDIAERKTRFGTTFFGCTRYPKCDFTANGKPVPKKCPECGSPYLIEKTLKSGVYLTCPNNKKPAAADEKTSKRKKKGEDEETGVTCTYAKRLRDAPPKAEETEAAPARRGSEVAQPVA